MAIRESALVPFYYTYSTGGIFGFYANGDSTEATDLLMVRILSHSLYSSSDVMQNLIQPSFLDSFS